jgi:pimeloyl-ACP methyl ester carboxylesterase
MFYRILAAALLATAFAPSLASSKPSDTDIALHPCRLEHPAKVLAVVAHCGTLQVPEDYAKPAGRKIALAVARVSAVNQRNRLEPLFVIAGGPGMGSAEFYASVATAFDRVHRDRDILIVDQRGTGDSNRLDCEFDEESLEEVSPETLAKLSAQCRDELAKRADLTQYTTSVAVRDLDAVRQALGYQRVNLYGVSYGTRVAQHYARQYPEQTRALILDGVVDPSLVLGPAMALDAEAALLRILERCRKTPSCDAAFGDPSKDYRELRAKLTAAPVTVSLPDPRDGTNKSFEFGRVHLSAVLRLGSYTPDQAALLPLALKLANRDSDYRALAGQYLMMGRSLSRTMSYGMHNAVVCSEDIPFFAADKLPRGELAGTHMGEAQIDQLLTLCAAWPRGVVDANFRAPLKSAAAALLLSGSDDPVTPPAYAEQARKAFADNAHLVVSGFGHGQITTPCVNRIVADFLRAGTAKNLDLSCTAKLKPMPFFTSPAGPAP